MGVIDGVSVMVIDGVSVMVMEGDGVVMKLLLISTSSKVRGFKLYEPLSTVDIV